MNAMLPITSLSTQLQLQSYMKPGVQMTGDTRVLKAGDVMLAYPMGNARQLSDNRPFITHALSLGASLVLYEPKDLSQVVSAEDLRLIEEDSRCVAVQNLTEKAGELAAYWYGEPSQVMQVIGVTGTNGKTTITQWIAQALQAKQGKAAVMGTLGAGLLGATQKTGFTTPDAPRTHALLKDMLDQGASSVAIEVSSHALDQGRINGVEFDVVVVSNLTQDHLDYHGDMLEYANAKKKILHLPHVKHIIINADDDFGQTCLTELAKSIEPGTTVWAYATQAEKLLSLPCYAAGMMKKILAEEIHLAPQGMTFNWRLDGQELGQVKTQVIGLFNVSNTLAVMAALLASGCDVAELTPLIEQLKPVMGRMELVPGKAQQSPMAIVDFAHTPDALEQTLKTLRVIAKERSGQLWCIFGCGGDRDPSKRPVMGRIAERFSDHVMVTSDNPRSENPEKIISEILSGCEVPEKVQTNSDRATAILQVIRQAKEQDVVLVAGKGHEDTQEIAGKRHAFSDQLHLQIAMGGAAV